MPRAIATLTAVLLAWCFMPSAARAQAQPEPLSAFPQSLLAIRTASGHVLNFKIWSADTPQREQQGLMFIRDLDEHAGMIFVFGDNFNPVMWMKNTYISLDLLFIDKQGHIQYIARQAEPLSLSLIQSPKPSMAVLELKGGACEKFGIKEGDSVIHTTFHNAK